MQTQPNELQAWSNVFALHVLSAMVDAANGIFTSFWPFPCCMVVLRKLTVPFDPSDIHMILLVHVDKL